MSNKLNVKQIFQEQLFVTSEPSEITTVVGSCIAVCLWDNEKKIAGMNHYMLPLWNGDGLKTLKYGNIAIVRLVDEMYNAGAKKKNLVAKVFGGAAINLSQTFGVGERNIKVAYDVLADCGIPIVAKDVGSNRGRKIILSSIDGGVFIRYASS